MGSFPAGGTRSSTYKLRKKKQNMGFISTFFMKQFLLAFPGHPNRIWES